MGVLVRGIVNIYFVQSFTSGMIHKTYEENEKKTSVETKCGMFVIPNGSILKKIPEGRRCRRCFY